MLGHSLDRCKCFIGFAGDGCEDDLDGVTTCARNCTWPRGTCQQGRCTCVKPYAGHDCSIELRHGQLSHALDSAGAKIGAMLAGLAISSLVALALLRFINVGVSIKAANNQVALS